MTKNSKARADVWGRSEKGKLSAERVEEARTSGRKASEAVDLADWTGLVQALSFLQTDSGEGDMAAYNLQFQSFMSRSMGGLLARFEQLYLASQSARTFVQATYVIERLLVCSQYLLRQSVPIRTAYFSISLDMVLFCTFMYQLDAKNPRSTVSKFRTEVVERVEGFWHKFIASARRHLDIFDIGLSDVMLIPIPDEEENAGLAMSRRSRLTILANTNNNPIGMLAACILDLLGHPVDWLPWQFNVPDTNAPVSAREKMRRYLSEPLFAELRTMDVSVCYACGKYESGTEYSHCSRCGIATFCSRDCQVTDWKSKDKGHRPYCKKLDLAEIR